jgi:hypothetical protein
MARELCANKWPMDNAQDEWKAANKQNMHISRASFPNFITTTGLPKRKVTKRAGLNPPANVRAMRSSSF